MIKSRAAVAFAAGQPLQVVEIDVAPPQKGEVLVRITAAGLCHSDLSVIEGNRPRPMPMVLGHEATGIVEGLGEHVHDFVIGDAVVFSFVPSCGHCAPCAEGRAALCEPGAKANGAGTLLSGGMRWSLSGTKPHHHLGVSGFAEATVVSARSAVKIDRDLKPEIAALFGCAVMTGMGAVVNTAAVRPGQSVAVFGLGGVGLSAVLGAVAAGAYPIVAIDRVPEKLALAKSLGASHTVLADDNTVEAIRAATHGGAQVTVETVGHEAVLVLAYQATRRGGLTVTAGLPHPSKLFSIPAVSLVAEERTVKGSYMGSAVPQRDIPRYIALHRAGRLPVEKLLTHTLKLDEINAGFDRLAKGEAVRQVVLFD